MTSAGALATLRGPGRRGTSRDRFALSDHGCWGYTSDAERARAAAEWLVDGLQQEQRGIYVGSGTTAELTADLAAVPDCEALIRDGVLLVFTLTDLYDLSRTIDPETQLATYHQAVEQALDDGFLGVRAVADITELVADPARRRSHVHWEQVADRYITHHPLAPLCLYDARRLTDIEAIVDCHPLQGPDPTPFALYATGADTGALTGELDLTAHAGLDDVLAGLPGTDHVLDISGLSFMDGRAAYLLHKQLVARRSAGQCIRLAGASPALHRLWSICRFDTAFLA